MPDFLALDREVRADIAVPPFATVVRRHRRLVRRRRGVVAGAVAALLLAATAVPVGLSGHGGSAASPGAEGAMTFPSDEQLSTARWFHLAFRRPNPSCPAPEEEWYDRAAEGPGGQLAGDRERLATDCGLHHVVLPRYVALQDGQHRVYDLTDPRADPAYVVAQLKALPDDPTASAPSFVLTATDILVAPSTSAVRRALVAALKTEQGFSENAGRDALGRPVRWLRNRAGTTWYGLAQHSDWIIAYGSGAADSEGGPLHAESLVTAIDNTPPPTDLQPTANGSPKAGPATG